MNNPPTKAALSPNRRRLVETMQQLNFGRIEGLAVTGPSRCTRRSHGNCNLISQVPCRLEMT